MSTLREIEEDMQGSVGFSASLSSASLPDLVQMQCLSGARSVARVNSVEEVGYLYFREGRIVHAMSASNVGEAAALEILSWSSGSFELCKAGWPDHESIHATFQGLLLRAAQARDESGRHSLLRFQRPQKEAAPEAADQHEHEQQGPSSTAMPPPASSDAKPLVVRSSGPPNGVTRVQAAVRLDATGRVVSSKGTGARELGDATALAIRVAELVGEALGLEGLLSIEAASSALQTLIVVEKTGSVVALRAPSSTDLSAIRERYGV